MSEVMCPHCNSLYLNKAGQKNGKQRYLCKACGKKFTYGKYIKSDKERKGFNNKVKYIAKKDRSFNFENLTINEVASQQEDDNQAKNININLNEKILNIIERDLQNNSISLNKYIEKQLSSEEENEVAKRLAKIETEKLELCVNKELFKNHKNEKMHALIIKILIASGEEGIKILMEYINNLQEYKMTKYNFNVIGKHMSQDLYSSWRVIKEYIREGISKNCAYTITRYIYYVSKLSYKELKNNLIMEEIRNIYFDKKTSNIFRRPKIEDSDYLNNFDEYHYSLSKILDKMAQQDLINYKYLEQYNSSIFTEDSYIERMLSNANLSKKGEKIIGRQRRIFCNEYRNMMFRCSQKDFDMWLDKYSNFIYKTILQYGIDEYESFFYNDWGREFVFRCKISSKETEMLAEQICEEYFKNPRKDYSNILNEVFMKLLYIQNDKAIDTLIHMIDNDIIVEEEYTFYQNVSFDFIMGITKKFYGDFYNIKKDYSYRRIHKGNIWETISGYIIKENYNNVVHHPVLDNNKIPDYGIIKGNQLEKIIECKLILGFREFEETINKYHNYCNNIEFYCLRNDITESVRDSDEYKSIMNRVSKNFKYEIKDFNDVYKTTNQYADTLFYFEKNVKKVTQKNLLKEKICANFNGIKKEKLLYLLDRTFSQSELF